MPRLILTSVLTLLTLTACERPREGDRPEIAERHIHRYKGECASWLRSHQTGFTYCASPPFEAAINLIPEVKEKPKDGPVTKDALMARGEEVYGSICAACHQANGQGIPGTYPPLAGAGEFYGDPKKHAGIIVKGLSGPITVLGVEYNSAMPPQAQLTDYEVAAVATYVRHSWGNDDGIVTPDDAKAAR